MALVFVEIFVYTHLYTLVLGITHLFGDERMLIARKRTLPQSSYGKGAAMAQRITLPFLAACVSISRGPDLP